MLSFDGVIQDIVQRRGKLGSKDGNESAQDYQEVWSTFVAYVKSCMEQRRGLLLSTFCKIGWIVQKKQGKPVHRPYFQFADPFVRSYLSQEAARKHAAPAQGDLCPFEDFNFSKAAIKFSNQLTKDQVFTMLRGLAQRIGELISEGKEVDIALGDVGKLTCRGDRDPRFVFSHQFYEQEGEAPPPMATEGSSRSAAAFRKEAAPEAMSLGIRGGNTNSGAATPQEFVATQPMQPQTMELPTVHEEVKGFDSGYDRPVSRGLMSSASAPSLQPNAQSGDMKLTATQFKKEVAYKEAMDRHIAAMEAHAAEAVNEKEAWQSHVEDCMLQEREEIQARRERNHMNLHFLQHQMQLGEQKRKEQRKEDIEAASAHDFPTFTEVHPSEMKEFIKGQQSRMKTALDEQVRTNNTLRNLHKQKERSMELNQLQANREEMAMLRNAERAKKAYDREALATAWNSDIRMKNIWKAIENHSKVASHPPQVMMTDGLPPSRGGSVASAGRIMTGSSRRAPLGCSTSLSQLQSRGGSSRGIM
eukprot:TRINITY_DN77851_c0_g1_i1.p1 TRINITY_DN77851_c0_g1~~TRINITY_DN77851_c0_g1_i1.p1  ORF type:complete len:530 (-),score=126.21 TRINITY_DN77851_c0_g1_i1:56-1645(-)